MTFQNKENITLDSRLIFETDIVYFPRVTWTRPDPNADSEWIYMGLHDDFKKDIVSNVLEKVFPANTILYIKHQRSDSTAITATDFMARLSEFIGMNIRIWDSNFERIAEFHDSGVFRTGKNAST